MKSLFQRQWGRGEGGPSTDIMPKPGQLGVFWQTQGSGKSFSMPAHDWFGPWQDGLALLNCSYEKGTAAHLDVSYRPTKAMLRNPNTDRREFRHMVECDVAWLFRLLPLCPKLRGLLVFGPVVRHDGSTESLAGFVRKSAPRHGFNLLPDGGICLEHQGGQMREFFLHEVKSPDAGTITEQVVANLTQYRDGLLHRLRLQI